MAKKKRKKSEYFKFLNPKNLKREIEHMGYQLNMKNLIMLSCILGICAFIAGNLLHLQVAYMGILILVFIGCVPFLFLFQFQHSYQVDRFNDIVEYMEQMIYSFHKTEKIRDSLEDTYQVSKGNIKEIIEKMRTVIDTDLSTPHLFEKAFSIMQEEYDCARLMTLHEYLVEIEYNGGESFNSLNMLLEDIRAWAERTLLYQQDRRNVKNKVLISTIFAMFSCGMMINMIPEEYGSQIVVNPIYQVGTLVILTLCVLLYLLSAAKTSTTYLDNELDEGAKTRLSQATNDIIQYHQIDHKKKMKKNIIILIPLVLVSIYVALQFGGVFNYVPVVVALISVFIIFKDKLHYNTAVKNVKREIEKAFPQWIRNMVLYLQTDNVHVSIKRSLNTCPLAMKAEVEHLIKGIEKDPISNKPYNLFLSSYDLPNLKLAANYLYSISQFGAKDIIAQLDYLIQQNARLTIAAEKARNEDALAGFTILMLVPMLLAVFKLVLDLGLFVLLFFQIMSEYNIF